MSQAHSIVVCPPDEIPAALALALSALPPLQRDAFCETLGAAAHPGLFVAVKDDQVEGACWAQPQAGNSAIFWPAQLAAGVEAGVADQLTKAVTEHLAKQQCGIAQVLVDNAEDSMIPVFDRHGFVNLAELIYLSSEPAQLPVNSEKEQEIEFETFHASIMKRLKRTINATYQGTLDCPALNGVRTIEEVISGYLTTGIYDPRLWFLVRHEGADVGVLLLTSHPELKNWELIYMGLVPEARGSRWGVAVVRHAQMLAKRAGVERLVLAVDAQNRPALEMYAAAGFTEWDRRHVFARSFRDAVPTSDAKAA